MTDSTKTININLTPITKGFPHVHDVHFASAIANAKQGGDLTQQWFDSQNQTSDFWAWISSHTGPDDNPFAPGVDPDGNPIQMASSGNVEMRNGAFFRGQTDKSAGVSESDPPPIVGIGTIQTHNTTSNVSRDISFGLGLLGIPPSIVLSKALFADLLKPVYSNFKTWITKMSAKFKESSEVESPEIDPEEQSEEPLEETSSEVGDIGGDLAEQGAEYLAINWSNVLLESAGLAAIVAIPLLVSFLGHKMVNSVEIHNLTDLDFKWSVLAQVHGEPSILPKNEDEKLIPKMDYNVDSWGDRTTVKVAYSADFQFINSTDFTDIGYVLGLTPVNGSTTAKVVVSIPWAGDNTIWVGESNDDPNIIYDEHSMPDQKLSVVATFDTYQVTWSLSKLRGETDGAYFYGVLGVIEPKA